MTQKCRFAGKNEAKVGKVISNDNHSDSIRIREILT
jgi:hypothetical protein